MTNLRKAAQQALEALQEYQSNGAPFLACDGAVAALKAALTQQDESEMYAAAYSSACGELRKVEAQRDALLELVVEMDQHEGAEGWSEDLRIKINSALMQALEALAWKAGSEPALYGAQTLQAITALRAALAQQDEPHPGYPCRSDGRCQYAIDHGAEGLGSCPKGKCAMAQPQPAEDRAVAQDNLRAALAQQAEPVQEPVAWLYEAGADSTLHWNKPPLYGTPLYTAPPKRQPETIDEALQQPRAMAQAYENGYKAGVAHEREACERACKHQPHWVACAAAIRARGVQS